MNIVQEKRAHFKKSLPWKRIFAAVAAVLLAVVTIFSALKASKMPTYAASKDLYFDKDGNLCFESRDTKRTSGIGYETVGYTFHQANADGSINESGAYASMGFTGSKEPINNSDGIVTTVYYMDAANLQSAMNKVDPSGNWYNSFVNGDGTIYASAIMRTFTMTGGKKTPSGYINVTNGEMQYHGKIYDFRSIEALAKAYNWAGSGADDIRYEHFRKKLSIKTPKKQDILNQQESDSKVDGDYAGWHMSGRNIPYVLTYHTDATYDVGEGIPSGKSLTNGIVADDWYGSYAYSERSISDDFTPSYNISYTVRSEYLDKWTDENGEEHEETKVSTSSGSKTVEVETSRSALYYAIRSLQLYSYNGVIVSNDSYGKATYGNPYSLEWNALINGTRPTGADSYSPDDRAHIDYEDTGDPGFDAGTFDHEPSEEELLAAVPVQEHRYAVYVGASEDDTASDSSLGIRFQNLGEKDVKELYNTILGFVQSAVSDYNMSLEKNLAAKTHNKLIRDGKLYEYAVENGNIDFGRLSSIYVPGDSAVVRVMKKGQPSVETVTIQDLSVDTVTCTNGALYKIYDIVDLYPKVSEEKRTSDVASIMMDFVGILSMEEKEELTDKELDILYNKYHEAIANRCLIYEEEHQLPSLISGTDNDTYANGDAVIRMIIEMVCITLKAAKKKGKP